MKIQKCLNRNGVLQTLRHFKEMNAERYAINQMGLFGSLARETDNENSDVDVVVELSEPDLFVLISIKQNLEEILKCHVDIVRYRETMNPFLKKRIQKEAVYV